MITPLSGTAFSAVGIFAFIQAWAAFIWPLLVANNQLLFNMEVGLTAFQFKFSTDYGKLMAGSVISVAADADRLPDPAPAHHRERGADGHEGLSALHRNGETASAPFRWLIAVLAFVNWSAASRDAPRQGTIQSTTTERRRICRSVAGNL